MLPTQDKSSNNNVIGSNMNLYRLSHQRTGCPSFTAPPSLIAFPGHCGPTGNNTKPKLIHQR